MKRWVLTCISLTLAAGGPLATLEAQAAWNGRPNLGVGLLVGVPTGALGRTSYGDGSSETYNTGLGAQFTLSWPVAPALSLRLNASGITFQGTGRAPQTYDWNVQDQTFSLGGEAELFLADGNAARHLGTYLLGGLHADFERFSASNYDPSYDAAAAVNKTRLGATLGLGHTFRTYGGYRWSLEAAYHKTLTDTASDDSALVGFPAADYVQLYAGYTF